MNNKVHTATKVLPFMANYSRELRMGADIRKKSKVEKATEFVKRMRKVQKNIKRQVDKERKESEDWKKEDKVLLSTKDLVFKETGKKTSKLIYGSICY